LKGLATRENLSPREGERITAVEVLEIPGAGMVDVEAVGRWSVFYITGSVEISSRIHECDRRGLLVWQDFMFSCGPSPTGIAGLDRLYREEAEFEAPKDQDCRLWHPEVDRASRCDANA